MATEHKFKTHQCVAFRHPDDGSNYRFGYIQAWREITNEGEPTKTFYGIADIRGGEYEVEERHIFATIDDLAKAIRQSLDATYNRATKAIYALEKMGGAIEKIVNYLNSKS